MTTPAQRAWALAAALLAAGTPPSWAEGDVEITGMDLRPGQVRLTWPEGMDRYIVEQFALSEGGATAVGTSSGRVDHAISVPAGGAAVAFYRVRQGLQGVPLVDEGLAALLRSALGDIKIAPTNWLYDADLNALGRIDAQLRGIRSLEGMNGILALQSLDFGGNQLGTLGPIGAIQGLQTLRADGNQLTDLAALAGLEGLHVLDVSNNQISDLGPLAALTTLEILYLDQNQVTSLAPLAQLLHLRILDLSGNRIESLAPLLANAAQGGLGDGDLVYLAGNPGIDLEEVATLRGYGVNVIFP